MRALIRHGAFGAALLIGAIEAQGANPPSALDLPPSNIVVPAPVEMSAGPAEKPAERAQPSGNPLWAIPLSSLAATRDRPLFLPSRRAPAPAVAGPVTVVPIAAPPPPAEPERPQLQLIGAIANGQEGFAVFLDPSTNSIVRLKTGQNHDGWVLRSVKGREATLEKDKRSATLALPVPGSGGPPIPGMLGIPGIPGLPGAVPLRPGGKQKEPEL